MVHSENPYWAAPAVQYLPSTEKPFVFLHLRKSGALCATEILGMARNQCEEGLSTRSPSSSSTAEVRCACCSTVVVGTEWGRPAVSTLAVSVTVSWPWFGVSVCNDPFPLPALPCSWFDDAGADRAVGGRARPAGTD